MPAHTFRRPRGRLIELTIDSRALRGNLCGDPHVRQVPVYLPPGYDEGPGRYPLFVDLVGFTGSGFSHLNWKPFGESVPQRLDRLVEAGEMGPVVAAFPDAFTSLGGNQYINSVATGRWEDFLIDEMVPELESTLRLRGGPEGRALFGKSSGGYGAIVHGLRRADAWGAVACHSGDMAFEWCYRAALLEAVDVLALRDRSVGAFFDHLAAGPKISSVEMHTLMALAMGATYDPDPAAPKGARLPVDLYTGELIEARWQAWLAHDPLTLVRQPACLESLRQLRGLWIDCGRRDQYRLHYGARRLHLALQGAGIEHTFEEFDDNHSAIDYRMDRSLPFLYSALSRR